MKNPKVVDKSWELMRTHVDSYGEEIWCLTPKYGDWSAVIHLQSNGKMYLTLFKGSKKKVDQAVLSSALRSFSKELLKRGITPTIGVIASKKNTALFRTVRLAGFCEKTQRIKNRRRPDTVVFEFKKK